MRFSVQFPKLQQEAQELMPSWSDLGLDDVAKYNWKTCVCMHGIETVLKLFVEKGQIPLSVINAHHYIKHPRDEFYFDGAWTGLPALPGPAMPGPAQPCPAPDRSPDPSTPGVFGAPGVRGAPRRSRLGARGPERARPALAPLSDAGWLLPKCNLDVQTCASDMLKCVRHSGP